LGRSNTVRERRKEDSAGINMYHVSVKKTPELRNPSFTEHLRRSAEGKDP